MNEHITEVKALVGPFDIRRFTIDYSAEHNSMGFEEFRTYGGEAFTRNEKYFTKQKSKFTNPSDPKSPIVSVLGYFVAKFWSRGVWVNDRLYILAGSHLPRVGKQLIREMGLCPKFVEDINDTHSFPPLGRK